MIKASISRRAFVGWITLLVGLSLSGLVGCGKKAAPVAPRRPLPPVTELKGRLDGDTVTLTGRRQAPVKSIRGYDVLRAQTSAANPPCPGCPLVFQKAGMITVDGDAETFEFSEQVPQNFIYIYKVQPVGSSGDVGPDSNSVTIDRSVR